MATILNHHPPFVFFLLFLLLIKSVATNDQIANATNTTNYPPPPPPHMINSFKPGIAVIVGISTTIFSATFLLLLYLKHCKRTPQLSPRTNNHTTSAYYANQRAAWRTNSGLNRKLIGSLPTFRFSSLRGQKEGLECAVCLNRFEPDEVLRLLPKCKHAFHVECVDTWLDAHSTCPLCRYRVDPEDVLLLDNFSTNTDQSDYCCYNVDDHEENEKSEELAMKNNNPRISGRHSEKSVVEMIVEKNRRGADFDRKRSSLDGWINYSKRKLRQANELHKLGENQNRKDGELPVKEKHKLEHRIIIGEEYRRRWSDAQVKEYLYLESENLIGNGMRSMSEMTKVSRYSTSASGNNGKREEEKIGNRWLAWISQSKQQQNTEDNHHASVQQQQPDIATLSSSSATGSVVV